MLSCFGSDPELELEKAVECEAVTEVCTYSQVNLRSKPCEEPSLSTANVKVDVAVLAGSCRLQAQPPKLGRFRLVPSYHLVNAFTSFPQRCGTTDRLDEAVPAASFHTPS